MDWTRERDGIVVVGAVVLLLLVVGLGGMRGFVATFVATFLGVFAALRVNEMAEDDESTAGAEERTSPVPSAVGDDAPAGTEISSTGDETDTEDEDTTDTEDEDTTDTEDEDTETAVADEDDADRPDDEPTAGR